MIEMDFKNRFLSNTNSVTATDWATILLSDSLIGNLHMTQKLYNAIGNDSLIGTSIWFKSYNRQMFRLRTKIYYFALKHSFKSKNDSEIKSNFIKGKYRLLQVST